MEKIINQSHDRHTLLFACSRLFERCAYYGIQAIIILYMINESLVDSDDSAIEIYGYFTGAILFSKIIGALVGDLIIGNRRALVIGVVLQIVGALSFCIHDINGIYVGLALVSIGAGLYNPNIQAQFGKMYMDRKELMDSAFVILSLFVNIGAALGAFFIAYIGEMYGWSLAFIAAASSFIFSLILIVVSKRKEKFGIISNSKIYNKNILIALILLTAISLYWTVKEIAKIKHSAFQFVENVEWEIPSSMFHSIEALFLLPTSIIMIIIWTKYYRNPIFKVGIGFVLGAVSFVLLFAIPEQFTLASMGIYAIAMLLLGFAELYIQPVMESYLVRKSNPKYLAIILCLAFVPGQYLTRLLPIMDEYFINNSQTGVIIAIVVSVLLVGFIFLGPFKRVKN